MDDIVGTTSGRINQRLGVRTKSLKLILDSSPIHLLGLQMTLNISQGALQVVSSSLRNMKLLSNEGIHLSKNGNVPSLDFQIKVKVCHRHIDVMQSALHRLHTSRRLSLRYPSNAQYR